MDENYIEDVTPETTAIVDQTTLPPFEGNGEEAIFTSPTEQQVTEQTSKAAEVDVTEPTDKGISTLELQMYFSFCYY